MGWTAIHFAALNGHKTIVERLLYCCESTVDIEDINGLTPLWLASRGGHVDCVDVLLVHGANPEHKR